MRITRHILLLPAILLALTSGELLRRQSLQRRLDAGAPPAPPAAFSLTARGAQVTFYWQPPPSLDLAEVRILRRTDGRFPASPADGELIAAVPAPQRAAAEFVRLDTLPAAFHYAAFACDTEGRCSAGAQGALYCDFPGCVTLPGWDSPAGIVDPQEAVSLRQWVREQFWQGGLLPQRLPDQVIAVEDGRYPSAAHIQLLTIEMGRGIQSRAALFTPPDTAGGLAVYHHGHSGDFHDAAEVINRLLEAGWRVLALDMPLAGGNPAPPGFAAHADLARLPRPLHYFVEPVVVGLNYAAQGEPVIMLGISGGGWTTMLVKAIDPRVRAGYSVAGGYPEFIRDQIPGNDGDFEQRTLSFWGQVSYLQMFVLAAGDGRFVQAFNYHDPCCSEGSYALAYRAGVADAAAQLGGSFDVWLDYDQTEHAISLPLLERLLADLPPLNP
jgi:hypothetical protein